ncbi:alpha/beta-hydrolase [Exidia glandulosa HHB12029]|uniref:Alpha/beta-hydrolase n=1 Tax=Exidia glandulosa HHB12029 TaxID=1314781 RepID=A0A165CV69_EXIGL|nr:alpha/beta-hydrolase [Exidia glandulosa HHB12029]
MSSPPQSAYAAFCCRYGNYWQTLVTARGLTYRYLSVPAGHKGVVLLFLHGFTSSVYDWHYQLDYFHNKGYGLLAPDMLGYGGSDKPRDTKLYQHTPLARDIMDIVAAEVPPDVPIIPVGHNWGVAVMNRLVCHHGKRFKGFVFLNVAYMGPNASAPYDLDELIPLSKQMSGKELYAYWELFTKPGADKICEDNIESFLDMMYAEDEPSVSNRIKLTRHKSEEFVENGMRLPRAKFIRDEDYEVMRDHLVGPGRGMWGPLAWYKMWTDGHHRSEDQVLRSHSELADEGLTTIMITQPVIFFAAARDAICVPSWMRPLMEKVSRHLTTVVLDTSHWIFLEQPDMLNAELDKWLEGKVLRTRS